MVTRPVRLGAVAAVMLMTMAQPGLAVPARDGHLARMAARLFPTLSGSGNAVLIRPADAGAAGVLADRQRRMEACAEAAPCLIDAALWTDAERDQFVRAAEPARRDDLRREINGLNGVLQVYGIGKLPHYPLIDGSDEPFGSERFGIKVADAVALSTAQQQDAAVAGDRSLGLALALLDVNDDDQAIAFEPLDQTYNSAAFARARTVNWARYRYTAIIALGVGPDELPTPLSPRGKVNVRMAADALAEGLAPFIIVSGAAVHPRGATHVEAIEMRRALMERFGIAADHIVIEPYARHTTTNLRNATRRLIAMGAPLDRETLVVSNAAHIGSIEGAAFFARNQRELGYQPGTIGTRVSPTAIPFRPSALSQRIDPADPRDP